jgi:uncharacterized protein (DUF2384 family)
MQTSNAQNVSSQERVPPSLADPETRLRLSASGLRTFLQVSDRWSLSVPQQQTLLGGVPRSTLYSWRNKEGLELSHDQLERISLVLGIWKGLRLLFAEDAAATRWLMAENSDQPFAGQSPLETMLRGSIDDLFAVRRYIDGWRGVWP